MCHQKWHTDESVFRHPWKKEAFHSTAWFWFHFFFFFLIVSLTLWSHAWLLVCVLGPCWGRELYNVHVGNTSPTHRRGSLCESTEARMTRNVAPLLPSHLLPALCSSRSSAYFQYLRLSLPWSYSRYCCPCLQHICSCIYRTLCV